MATNILLSQPLSLSSIEIGRFVKNPLHPDFEFHQPVIPAKSDVDPAINACKVDVTVDHFKDIRDVVKQSRDIHWDMGLLDMLSTAFNNTYQTSCIVTSPRGTIQYLHNVASYFQAACQNADVQAWMEKHTQRSLFGRKAGRIYLVCGIRTLQDARVEQSMEQTKGRSGGITVPTATLAMAAAGAPPLITGFDVSVGTGIQQHNRAGTEYTALGEMVYAVQYRKILVSRCKNTKEVSSVNERSTISSKLGVKAHWKSYICDRGGGEEGEEDDNLIQAEVVESPTTDDLKEFGTFTAIDGSGKPILYQVEDDDDYEDYDYDDYDDDDDDDDDDEDDTDEDDKYYEDAVDYMDA